MKAKVFMDAVLLCVFSAVAQQGLIAPVVPGLARLREEAAGDTGDPEAVVGNAFGAVAVAGTVAGAGAEVSVPRGFGGAHCASRPM